MHIAWKNSQHIENLQIIEPQSLEEVQELLKQLEIKWMIKEKMQLIVPNEGLEIARESGNER